MIRTIGERESKNSVLSVQFNDDNLRQFLEKKKKNDLGITYSSKGWYTIKPANHYIIINIIITENLWNPWVLIVTVDHDDIAASTSEGVNHSNQLSPLYWKFERFFNLDPQLQIGLEMVSFSKSIAQIKTLLWCAFFY